MRGIENNLLHAITLKKHIPQSNCKVFFSFAEFVKISIMEYLMKPLIQQLKIEELNKRKTPIVTIDKSLEKYKGKNLFPEKLAKANDVLKRIGLPKLTSQ